MLYLPPKTYLRLSKQSSSRAGAFLREHRLHTADPKRSHKPVKEAQVHHLPGHLTPTFGTSFTTPEKSLWFLSLGLIVKQMCQPNVSIKCSPPRAGLFHPSCYADRNVLRLCCPVEEGVVIKPFGLWSVCPRNRIENKKYSVSEAGGRVQ